MTDTVGLADDRILSFIERIEHIEDEIKQLNEDKKDVFAEAKGEGFDVRRRSQGLDDSRYPATDTSLIGPACLGIVVAQLCRVRSRR